MRVARLGELRWLVVDPRLNDLAAAGWVICEPGRFGASQVAKRCEPRCDRREQLPAGLEEQQCPLCRLNRLFARQDVIRRSVRSTASPPAASNVFRAKAFAWIRPARGTPASFAFRLAQRFSFHRTSSLVTSKNGPAPTDGVSCSPRSPPQSGTSSGAGDRVNGHGPSSQRCTQGRVKAEPQTVYNGGRRTSSADRGAQCSGWRPSPKARQRSGVGEDEHLHREAGLRPNCPVASSAATCRQRALQSDDKGKAFCADR